MKILALDLATRTGWAFWDGQRLESGVQDFSPKRGESSGMRYLYFNRWLADIATKGRMEANDLMFYEQNFRRGGAPSEIAAGFSTRVQEFCARNQLEHGQVNVTTLKKWATQFGHASKEAMCVAASKAVGREISEDNEADAVLIACYAREQFGGNEWNAQPAAAGAIK